MTRNVNCFTRVRSDASVEVVGEAYHQNLVAMARPVPGQRVGNLQRRELREDLVNLFERIERPVSIRVDIHILRSS